MPRNPLIKFNKALMFFGEPYVIDEEDAVGSLTLCLPTVGDIVKVGNDFFFLNLNHLITNTTQYRLMLWEKGIDWNTYPDYKLFISLHKQVDPKIAQMLFKDVDFSKFEPIQKPVGEGEDVLWEITLWNDVDKVEINENVYNHIALYFRNAFNIFPEEKITNSNMLKEWYIRKDKSKAANEERNKDKEKTDYFLAAISAYLNYPGSKYNSKLLKEICIAEFYDSLQQMQYNIQKEAYIHGLYSGFVDGKNVKPDSLSIIRT